MSLSQKWKKTRSSLSSGAEKLSGFFNSLELAMIREDLREYRNSILPSYGSNIPERVQERYETLTAQRDRLLERLGLPPVMPAHVENYLKQQLSS